MDEKLEGLKEAYLFYKKVLKDFGFTDEEIEKIKQIISKRILI